jgi:hypothetical protein
MTNNIQDIILLSECLRKNIKRSNLLSEQEFGLIRKQKIKLNQTVD